MNRVKRTEEQTDFQGDGSSMLRSRLQFFLNSSYNRCASASDLSRSSFTSTTSNLSENPISNWALNNLRERLSGVSVPRSWSLSLSTSTEGTLTKMANALSPKYFLRFNPPFTSTSKITFLPSRQTRSISDFSVP